MADDINLAIDTLYDIAKMGGNDFSGTKMSLKDVPVDVMAVLKKWVSDVNIDMSDVDDDVFLASWFDDEHTFHAFTFAHSDPEEFNGTLVIGATGPNVLGVLGVSSVSSS